MYDLLVIGGGINGVGIARDAAGRGLKTLLCEKDDLASHTSSASSKMIHGGLRYLETYEFRLVRESLAERETLLRIAPHIVRPLRIVLPVEKGMRPAWMLRIGLFLYDHLARRNLLPSTKTLNLRRSKAGEPLKDHFTKGFEFSDCWADDARLVALNAVDAKERGADISTRTECIALDRQEKAWTATLRSENGDIYQVSARAIVNAAGPWVEQILGKFTAPKNSSRLRLVKGSHILTRRLYEGEHCYLFQSPDGRIIFAWPYLNNTTLIGTTDTPWSFEDGEPKISADETSYLCNAANEYFKQQITPADILWSYAGVRPLFDDQSDAASVVTRDYVFDLDAPAGMAPALSIFGGKLTTYRKLAEHALQKLAPYLDGNAPAWTADAPLPGGDFAVGGDEDLQAQIEAQYGWLPAAIAGRLASSYGTRAFAILDGAGSLEQLGQYFGAGLYEAEVKYLINVEFARLPDDILWRRTKLGLLMTDAEQRAFQQAYFFKA
jgi:glycerol-3-phosphate dehydrogenase